MNIQRSRLMHSAAWVFLFAFTATCTLFFFFSIVPGSLWWLPVAAFVAFEYGVLHWLDYHKHGAANASQWYCSLMMVCASVGAVTIATGLELIKWFASAKLIQLDLWWISYGVWAVVAIFPLNLVALVFCEVQSPSHKARYREVAQADAPQTVTITPDMMDVIDAAIEKRTTGQIAAIENGHAKNVKAPR